MRRRGFTLVEISIVIAILVVIMVAVWSALSQLGRSEKATDREATRALMQARLAEMLQRDLRSATGVHPSGDRGYRIDRWVLAGDKLEIKAALWRQVDEFKISRTLGSDPPQEFNFRGLLDTDSPGLTFRMDPLGDVVFNAE